MGLVDDGGLFDDGLMIKGEDVDGRPSPINICKQ